MVALNYASPDQQKAQEVLKELRELGVEVKNLCADSRQVQPGDVFLAYPGYRVDGRNFIKDAIQRGAAAVVWERAGVAGRMNLAVPSLAVDGLSRLSGYLADVAYGAPSQDLWVVGVTGTNGKTSVTQWLARAFAELRRKCAVIGTLGCGFPGQLQTTLNTTPDALTMHRLFRDLRAEGGQAVAMEVSSIGLDQGRVHGVHFDIAVLTNLTRDHLEYHGSMEDYAEAKRQLFLQQGLKTVVLNFDDVFGVAVARYLAKHAGNGAPDVVGYTLLPDNAGVAPATRVIVAHDLQMTASGLRMKVGCAGEFAELQAELVGQFNASNLLAVIGTLVSSGALLKEAVKVVARLKPPAGRMQILGGIGEPLVVVDYAHTPDALEKVLMALRPTVDARGGMLTVVFGCGGDRDVGKRPLMVDIACRLADSVLLTSDNPRSESPKAIIQQMVVNQEDGYSIELDRSKAICAAISRASADDVILLAGKGHEPYQEINGVRHPFSDNEEARKALAVWVEENL